MLADHCLQLFGGYRYMAEYPIARIFTDSRIQKIYGGTNEIMKEIIARGLERVSPAPRLPNLATIPPETPTLKVLRRTGRLFVPTGAGRSKQEGRHHDQCTER